MVARHNDVARNIHYALCKKYGLKPVHYTQVVPGVLENGAAILYWDQNLVTTTKLAHNKPDIALFDKLENRMYIIEVSVAWYSRISAAEHLKYRRYAMNSERAENEWQASLDPTAQVGLNLATELQKDRGCRVDVLPIVVGSCGEVSNSLHSHIEALGFKGASVDVLIERLTRSAVIGTHHIIKAHLSIPE